MVMRTIVGILARCPLSNRVLNEIDRVHEDEGKDLSVVKRVIITNQHTYEFYRMGQEGVYTLDGKPVENPDKYPVFNELVKGVETYGDVGSKFSDSKNLDELILALEGYDVRRFLRKPIAS